MLHKLRCRPDTGKREAGFRLSGGAPGVEEFARFAVERAIIGSRRLTRYFILTEKCGYQ
jgi:hypothetical protein